MTVYWLDADACIQAKDEINGAFPFSRMRPFWDYLSLQVDNGVVRAPKMVYDEIVKGNDELSDWFSEREDRGLAIYASKEVHECASRIGDYVVEKYGDRLARPFLKGADMWVMAHAMAMGTDGVVVTHETTRPLTAIIKIPAVCSAFGIERFTIFRMLNQLGARF